MFKRFILTALVLGVSVVLFSQVNPDSLPERYVKKVIIDAKWGNGPGEFGIAKWSDPIEGPGPITVDEEGNIYIADPGNFVIHKFDSSGKFVMDFESGKLILNFAILKDTMYAVGLDNINDKTRNLYLLDCKNGREILNVSIKKLGIPDTAFYGDNVRIESKNGNVFIEEVGKRGVSLTGRSKNSLLKSSSFILPTKILKKIKGRKDLPKGLEKLLLDKDKMGNYYFGIYTIYKVSSEGLIVSEIKLPWENYVGEHTVDKIFISDEGDIYYLYATGKIIEKDWKIHFIPGKVQVIKWELQR